MFAIAALIAASMAGALGSLVMDPSKIGLICRPAERACGAPTAGAALSILGRTPGPLAAAAPGSTTCTIGTGDTVMVSLPGPCAAAIRTGNSAAAVRQTRIAVNVLDPAPVV